MGGEKYTEAGLCWAEKMEIGILWPERRITQREKYVTTNISRYTCKNKKLVEKFEIRWSPNNNFVTYYLIKGRIAITILNLSFVKGFT